MNVTECVCVTCIHACQYFVYDSIINYKYIIKCESVTNVNVYFQFDSVESSIISAARSGHTTTRLLLLLLLLLLDLSLLTIRRTTSRAIATITYNDKGLLIVFPPATINRLHHVITSRSWYLVSAVGI